jgi:hypothetical protein
MWLCTGEAKGGFAGKGDAPLLSTIEARVSYSELKRVAVTSPNNASYD